MKTQLLEPCIRTADAFLSSINDEPSAFFLAFDQYELLE